MSIFYHLSKIYYNKLFGKLLNIFDISKVFLLNIFIILSLNQLTLAKELEKHKIDNHNLQNLPIIVTDLQITANIIAAIVKLPEQVIVVGDNCQHHQHFSSKNLAEINKANIAVITNEKQSAIFNKIAKNNQLAIIETTKIPAIKILHNFYNQNIDIHLSLSPENGLNIAKAIAKALSEVDKSNKSLYQENFNKFYQSHQILISSSQELLKNWHLNGRYMFFHNGYRYFEDFFKLQSAIILKEDHQDAITAETIIKLNQLQKNNVVKCLIADSYSNNSDANKIAKKYQLNLLKINNDISENWGEANNLNKKDKFNNRYHQQIFYWLQAIISKC